MVTRQVICNMLLSIQDTGQSVCPYGQKEFQALLAELLQTADAIEMEIFFGEISHFLTRFGGFRHFNWSIQ